MAKDRKGKVTRLDKWWGNEERHVEIRLGAENKWKGKMTKQKRSK